MLSGNPGARNVRGARPLWLPGDCALEARQAEPVPMTALRLTPISRAICPHESPASIRSFRSAMRSVVHVV